MKKGIYSWAEGNIFEYQYPPLMHSRILSFMHFILQFALKQNARIGIRATRLSTPEVQEKQGKQRIGSEMFFQEGDGTVQLVLNGSFGKVQF